MLKIILSCAVTLAAIAALGIADKHGERCELRRDTVFMTGRPAVYRVCYGSITGFRGDGTFVRYED